MKKAALINDISGLGKCSLVADISVLTAMSVEACPFPTAVLNAQTGFPAYTCLDLTERMRAYTEGWADLGIRFKGILTGFLMNEKQAEEVLRFTEMFHEPDTLLLVDPVLADHGKPYANFHDALLEKMKELARDADILTPNISELCLLTDADMQEVLVLDGADLENRLSDLAGSLLNKAGKTVIVTGIPGKSPDTDEKQIGNLIVTESGEEMIPFPVSGRAYSGTGDLFAAAVLGGMMNGRHISEAVRTAGRFVMHAVADAEKRGVPGNDGTDYEKHLTLLAEVQ